MPQIKAIGFDLFNTLIVPDMQALPEAMSRLIDSLQKSGFFLDQKAFKESYREAALRFIEATRQDGRETHNRFWICAALETQGYPLQPNDLRINEAVEAYFSAFPEHCHLIPGTRDMLQTLQKTYRLGLLSNFTHAPAAREIIEHVGLTPFFDVIVISGEEGFRKPHPSVFHRLVEGLGVQPDQVAYVGDDPEPDIAGAKGAGLRPVWTTYVEKKELPFSLNISALTPEDIHDHVHRISTWQDLFVLLKEL
jgi:HAD superfamily hydrolase (TIGR01549 family)